MNLERIHATLYKGQYDWDGVLHVISYNDGIQFEYLFVSTPAYGTSRVEMGHSYLSREGCIDAAMKEGIEVKRDDEDE